MRKIIHKNRAYRFRIIFLFILILGRAQPAAVTYTFNGGRFGDNLITYLHAKWLSFLYDIPLLYKPFPYSDQLVMHACEQFFSHERADKFGQTVVVERGKHVIFDKSADILYIVPYFPESAYDHQAASFKRLVFNVDWANPFFKKLIKSVVAPINNLNLPVIPSDIATIAVHIRVKSGRDILLREEPDGKPRPRKVYSDVGFPLKHITDEYYVAQIKRLHDMLGRPKAYVYIFTDDANPPVVMERIKRAVNRPELFFDCRQPGEHHKTGVLEDFFAMTKFQYFVGNDSNFSMVASFISDYLISMRPIYDWCNRKVLVDEANIVISPMIFWKCLR